jgi:hypothetical protein
MASLIYVAEVIPEGEHEPVKIIIQSRVQKFVFPSILGGPKWRLDCVPLKGDITSSTMINPNKNRDPFALVTVNQYSASCAVGIQIVLGDNAYPICGGDYIDLPPSPLFRHGANPFQKDKPQYTAIDILPPDSPSSDQT